MPTHLLDRSQINVAWVLVQSGESQRDVAAQFGVGEATMSRYLAPFKVDRRPTIGRRMALIDRGPEWSCWLWQGHVRPDGYGQAGRSELAHRWSYETFVGPIPEGMHLDHVCRVRACVNPAHLEPVTREENLRRGRRDRGKPCMYCGHKDAGGTCDPDSSVPAASPYGLF